MGHHVEIETKFAVDERAELPALTCLPGVASVDPPETEDLEATYFDTEDLDLTAARITVRRRTGGQDAGWHLKLPATDGSRVEVRLPLGRAVRTVPKPLRDTVRAAVRDRPLSPVAVVATRRELQRVRDEEGRVIAEVADDHVSATSVATGGHPQTSTTWREWEIELVDGDRSFLRDARKPFRKQGAAPSDWTSKLRRTLAGRTPDTGTPPSPKPRRKGPAADVVLARLCEQAAEIRRCDPLVRQDLPGAVHDMRVAVRRLRSALASYRPLLDKTVTEPLRDELQWLGKVLGDARDEQVLGPRLRRRLDDEPAALLQGPVRSRTDRELSARYRDAHARATEALDSERYLTLLDAFDALLDEPPWRRPAHRRATRVLPARVRHDWKRLERAVAAVPARGTDDEERARRLHDVRKATKRARYATEPLRPLYGKESHRLVKALKRMQTLLGEHQDSVVARRALLELTESDVAVGGAPFTLGVLYAREEAAAGEVEDRFAALWRQTSRPALRRWL